MLEIQDDQAADGTPVTDGVGLIRRSVAQEILSIAQVPDGTTSMSKTTIFKP
jgi:hypothetical protein